MSEPYMIKMPQLSDTMTEGVLVSWEKDIGAPIKRGDIVATVETDKAIMDVEVFREGFLSGPRVPLDAVVKVGAAIAFIVADASQVTHEERAPSAAAAETVTEHAHESHTPPVAAQPSAVREPEGTTHVIKMPQLSDTMTEGVVVSWDKQPGDFIERGTVVAQVETDKAIMDVEVFREGYLSGPTAAVDSVIAVGAPLGFLVKESGQVLRDSFTGKAAAAAIQPEPAKRIASPPMAAMTDKPAPRPGNKYATPYARKLAAHLHVNLNNLKGSGPRGVITAADVQMAQPIERPSEIARQIPAHVMPEIQVPGHGREMSAMERAVSHSMTASLTMPTFRVSVLAKPDRLKNAAKNSEISLTVAIAKACGLAISKHPRVNSAYQPVDKIVERVNVDIGMAVAAEGGGLVVPVLRHCESRDITELSQSWSDLVDRARKRRLAPEEYSNPTFMISNMGMLGVHYFDAIPTPGTAAILAISSAGPEGMPLTVTADHRVVNGAEVAVFLNTLKEMIETPESWLVAPGPVIPPGKWDYDVLVIGAGPGGEDCARELVEHGFKVAMVNDAPKPGGECLWRGCIPSKAWRAAADILRDRSHDAELGIEGTGGGKVTWEALEKHRQYVLQTRGDMALKTDIGMKIKYVQGFARFETEHRVFVDTSNNSQDPFTRQEPGDASKGEHISFGCAVIATGAPPFVPPIPGVDQALRDGGAITSDTVWQLAHKPKSIAIIGAGAIGVEMAQIFQDFGSKVTLLEAQARILAEVEQEIAAQLTEILQKESGLTIYTSAKAQEISGKPGKMKLKFDDGTGNSKSIQCEYVMLATGKRPVLGPLNLEMAKVESERGVIKVDKRGRTTAAHIFAIGDVIGGYMLAHTAGQQGRIAAANIMGERMEYLEEKDCGVIFSRPQAAFVGLSVEQAKARKIDAVEIKIPMSIDAKAMITGKNQGMIKLVANRQDQRVIGVHFLADSADTLIGEAVMMVSAGMSLTQVAQAIHPHPTQTELFGEMARRLLSRLRRTSRMKAQSAA